MFPTIPGVPSWGAVLIAVTFTAIGFAFDAGSGDKELSLAFAAAYAIGCVAAVIAVRQTGVFTAVIQPPLLLFVTVPGAYFLFHGGSTDGVKDLLINCGYPLIERFPLMFFTSAVVLLIGLLRWYAGMGKRRAATAEASASESPGAFSAMTAKIAGLLGRGGADDDGADQDAPRRSRQHSIDRSARTAKTASASSSARTRSTTRSGGKPVKRTQPSRSRHTRPPETEIIEPAVERPRRPRPTRRSTEPPVPPPEPRRRTRSSSTSASSREPRKQPPPSERRSRYQRPDRHTRFDGFEPFEPHGTNGSNGNGSLNGTHHPVSRVRYRGADEGEQPVQYRSRPRASKHSADAWEYDV